MANITPDPVNPQGQINIKDLRSPADIKDSAALQICVQDTQNTEKWLQSNYWQLRWREADVLYQAPPSVQTWEGTTVPRANVTRFTVAETVNAIHPQVMNGLFYEDPPFVLRPEASIDQNTSRAITELLSIQLKEVDVREETDWGLFSALNFGTGIWKYGFKTYPKQVTTYKPLGQPITLPPAIPGMEPTVIETKDSETYVKTVTEVQCYTPTFENCDGRYVLVSSGCRVPDIRRAPFVVHKMYKTYRDLIEMKDEEYVWIDPDTKKQSLVKRYNLPSEAEIKSWFETPVTDTPSTTDVQPSSGLVHHATAQFERTTADPLDEPLEILERWDKNKVITVLQRIKCIRNEPNEFNCIPFLSVNWWNIPDAFWGIGLGRIIGVEQRVQAGLINACLDLANLIVNPMWVRHAGANIQTEQIRQRIGGIITSSMNPKDAITQLPQETIPSEVIQQITMSQQRVERSSGANEQLTMGATPGGPKSSLGRSGTGAAGIIQATMNRIGGFAEAFSRQVYQPLLYAMHDMNKAKMPMSYIKKVLGAKLGAAFKFDPLSFLSAQAEFEVLAGSHLAAKSQMAQSMFMMVQLFENAPLMAQLEKQNKFIDIEELFHMVHDLSGFKNYYSIVKDMTPEMLQAKQAASEAAQAQQATQSKAALQQQKAQSDAALIDQKNEALGVRDIFRELIKKVSSPEVLLGHPGGSGFGAPGNTNA